MKLFILIIALIYLLGNYYIFQRMWVVMPPSTIGRTILISFAVVAVSSFFLAHALGDVLPMGLASMLYKIGTSWFFISLYFLIIFLVKDIFALSNKVLHFIPSNDLNHYTKDNWLGLGLMVGFVTLLMVCGYLKYQWKVRVAIPVTLEKKMGDSTSQKSLRIVVISDLHLGYGIDKKEFEGWIETINSENPDIVLIAGDVIDNSLRPLRDGGFLESFSKIKAPLGIYACLGNHEYISGLLGSLDFLKKAGVHVLRDAVVQVDSSFYVIGRDDRSNPDRKPLSALLEGVDKTKPLILLDHQPYNLEEAETAGIDLQFSGHTHQGQVWPISLIVGKIYEKSHGFLKKGNTNIYVSSGIGLWGGKFRIGTQSEYVVVDVNK